MRRRDFRSVFAPKNEPVTSGILGMVRFFREVLLGDMPALSLQDLASLEAQGGDFADLASDPAYRKLRENASRGQSR
jgi:hypothetical protein